MLSILRGYFHSCISTCFPKIQRNMASTQVEISLGGNAFITKQTEDSPEIITDYGLGNWMDEESVCSVYFHASKSEEIELSLRMKVPCGGRSKIRVTVSGNQTRDVEVTGEEYTIVHIGRFCTAAAGYVKVDIQGISKTQDFFGDVSHLLISNVSGEICHVCEPCDFYFGRRGPSVHFSYEISQTKKPIEYFYNELYCAEGQDVVGSYFCAIGFCGGYFGMQVNSSTERRILFSIWSAYETDNPDEIPDDYQVELLKKGSDNVVVQCFGDEGSGQQSFLRYNWKAGVTYKFLVRGSPIDAEHTLFSGWFLAPEMPTWQLIARFKKPKTSCQLSSIYSFSENFIPEMGHVERCIEFGNQWARDVDGNWHEVCEAHFTADETANMKRRHDYAGGITNDQTKFHLTNCGFQCKKVEPNQKFVRQPGHLRPEIDISNLP